MTNDAKKRHLESIRRYRAKRRKTADDQNPVKA
jgi:hypothetical protein